MFPFLLKVERSYPDQLRPSAILHCSIGAVNAGRQSFRFCIAARPACVVTAHRAKVRRAYNPGMHIVALAWLYVTVLMALTESNVVAGILTLLFYGILPLALLLWIFGAPGRRRRAARKAAQATAGDQPDPPP